MPKPLLRFFQTFYGIYLGLLFMLAVLSVVPPYLLAGLLAESRRQRWYMSANRYAMLAWSLLSGIRFRYEHRERLRPDRAYVCVTNHCNLLDMPSCAIGFIHPVRPLAKVEFARIPVLGFIFKRFCVLVERGSSESRRRSAMALVRTLGQGDSILLFPEGTRNRTPEPLQPFRDGAFRAAIDAQVPILPFVQIGMRELQELNTLWFRPGWALVRYLEPIETTGMTEADVPLLRERVRSLIEAELLREDPTFRNKR
ncbi:lysophospholipid acyltransferase family protein [Chitinimonas lacunae]|uniref:Lysophospholipid acyltransferase family protein n=1 Tax=Chitinimonas lacunae TaxID=1963018 RepID=A0ABV8MSM5_9NEIS